MISVLRWALILPVAYLGYAGVLSMLSHLPGNMGPMPAGVITDWTGSTLFIVLAALIAPSRKHIVACCAFFVTTVIHTVMLMAALKAPAQSPLFVDGIYVITLGGLLVNALLTFVIVQHFLNKQRELELTADARRYYREWSEQGGPVPLPTPSQMAAPPTGAQTSSGKATTEARSYPLPAPQYETKVLTNEAALPREMTINVSLAFDEEGQQQRFTVADGKSIGFVKTALLLGILSPGHAMKFIFKPKKLKKRTLLSNPPWFKSPRELDSDAVDPRIESSQRDGDKLLTDTLNEYR
jgi:hypothetical protein